MNDRPEYKRVDRVYDSQTRDWKTIDVTTDDRDWSFIVRRTFGTSGDLKNTRIEIKSQHLHRVVLKTLPSDSTISTSSMCIVRVYDIFHYREELRDHCKTTAEERSKEEAAHTMLLLDFVDEEYKETDIELQDLLKKHAITYSLLWALFKPGNTVYTMTYQDQDEPRCFRVGFTDSEDSCFNVEGTYLDHDGKRFGMARTKVSIAAFKGRQAISDLAVYPLQYHVDSAVELPKQIVLCCKC